MILCKVQCSLCFNLPKCYVTSTTENLANESTTEAETAEPCPEIVEPEVPEDVVETDPALVQPSPVPTVEVIVFRYSFIGDRFSV